MVRENLSRAAKVVGISVARKRTARELYMDITPEVRAARCYSKRVSISADDRLDASWDRVDLLVEPHEDFASSAVNPRVMKECVDGYRKVFTNDTMKQHVCSVCSAVHMSHKVYKLSGRQFGTLFNNLLVPEGDILDVVISQYSRFVLGDETHVCVLSWLKEAYFDCEIGESTVEKDAFGYQMDGNLFDTAGVEVGKNGSLTFHVCDECFKSGEKGKTPEYAISKCWVGDAPDELKGLTISEQKLISMTVVRGEMVVLRGSGALNTRQRGLKGNIISFPVDVDSTRRVIQSLPHSLDHLAETLAVQYYGQNFEGDRLLVARVVQVRRAYVERALIWLKHNNKRYKDVVIDGEALEALPVEGIPPSFMESSVLKIDPRDVSEAEGKDAERSSYVPEAGKALPLDDVVLEASGFSDMGGNTVDCSTLRNSAMENMVLMAG